MRNSWRAVLGVVGAAALTTGIVVGSATSASADPTPGRDHVCSAGFFGGRIDDDGPLSDAVHHNVEPLLDPILRDTHELNCHTVRAVELGLEQMTGPGYLPGVVEGLSCLLRIGPC